MLISLMLFISFACYSNEQENSRIFSFIQDITEYMEEELPTWLTSYNLALIPIKDLRTKFAKHNPYKSTDANIAFGQISQEEYALIKNRKQIVNNSLKNPINIGICFSGGGYRAMIITLAIFSALKENNLLDTVLYACGLSGSSWAIASFISSQQNLDDFILSVRNNLQQNIPITNSTGSVRPITNIAEVKQLIKNLLKKFVYYQRISSVDIWGALILNNILNHIKRIDQKKLSTQKTILQKNNYFFPIYTAICPVEDEYEWYEFSPTDIRCLENNCYVKPWAFARKFINGSSISYATSTQSLFPQELPLTNLIGTFGSAYTINLKEIIELMHQSGDFDTTENYILDFLLNADDHTFDLAEVRAMPSIYRNFNFQINGTKTSKLKEITLIDAGIHANLPIIPMLQKERNLDLIIVCDTSSNVPDTISLQNITQYAQQHNLKLPKFDFKKFNKAEPLVFKQQGCPTILYLPVYDKCFETFCNTFNFYYSSEDFDTIFYKTKDIIKQKLLPAFYNCIGL